MRPQDLIKRIDSYLNGEASEEEVEWLHDYYNQFQQKAEWKETELGSSEETEARILQRLRAAIQGEARTVVVPFFRQRWPGIAAAVMLCAFGLAAWLLTAKEPEKLSARNETAKPVPLPDTDKTKLVLADGTVIFPDESSDGILHRSGNSVIRKQGNKVLFDSKPPLEKNKQAKSGFNRLTTPNGLRCEVVLSDGSLVWLNTGSSLQFPDTFDGNERRVAMRGEAYFEVTNDSTRPFRVVASPVAETQQTGAMIEVEAARFNITAYADEPVVKTTLLEGSIRIMSLDMPEQKPGAAKMLLPGELGQMVIHTGAQDTIAVSPINVEEVVAWKYNLFDFNNADIPTIMRQLARWYGVDVVYEGQVPVRYFTGKINRKTTLSTVLKILEQSDIHFQIRNKQIIVRS